MACGISNGVNVICSDLKRVGGINKRLWLFNIADLSTPIVAPLTAGYLNNIPLAVYKTLYKIEGSKFSHSFEINEQRTDSGNVQWEHKLMIKLFNTDPFEDRVLEDLSVAEVGAIIQSNNNEFFLIGSQNGLTATETKIQSGQKSGDDSTTSMTLTGNEPNVYLRLLRVDVNTTLTMLNAMSFN